MDFNGLEAAHLVPSSLVGVATSAPCLGTTARGYSGERVEGA